MEGIVWAALALALGAFIWPLLATPRAGRSEWAGWLAAIAPAVLFVLLLGQVGEVAAGRYPTWTMEWVPQMGVELSLRLDGVGLLMGLLITGIGVLILIYGGAYLAGSPQAPPFLMQVQFFMLAMLGVVMSDNLLVLFIFWELTSVTSYLLIGLSHREASVRQSALRALLVTGGGGLALFAAVLLLGMAGGTMSLAALQDSGALIQASPWYEAIVILVLLAAFTKSAQFPFHFWLPDAMAAPTPVSAYLHSATMVKAGVFLLAKLIPVLGGTVLWHASLTLTGAVTMLLGAVFALGQTDLKRLLAYSTVSVLGTLVMLLGIGTELAIRAAMVFLVVHALYKAPLFMIAGVLDKATGTRNVTLLQGLARAMPWLAGTAALAAFSMSGLPPFIGFIGKELLYEAQIHATDYSLLITIFGFMANAVNVAVALKVGISPFHSPGDSPEVNPKARKISLLLGPLLLAVAGAVIGLFPRFLGEGLVAGAVRDVLHRPVTADLKLWHGFNLLLLLSAVTVVAGVMLYRWRDPVREWVVRLLDRCCPVGMSGLFDRGLSQGVRDAAAVTRFFQHGNLRLYLATIFLSLSALIVAAVATAGWTGGFPQGGPLRLVPSGVAVLMILTGVAAIRSRSTVMAVLAMGGVGYGVALIFALMGAPDLALTQLLVETLMLALFMLIIRHLPEVQVASRSSRSRRISDFAIALAGGAAITLALLAVRSAPMPEADRVSAQMVEWSLPEANGRNVVNVILVDFRAFDTLGEISVLAIAGLGVGGLLLGAGKRNVKAEQAISTPFLQPAVTRLSPLLLFLSLFLLFRGHNEPGGGFIGGLMAAVGLILRRLAEGGHPFHAGRTPLLFIATGLATAMLSALPSLLFSEPFMKGLWIPGALWLPFVGMTKFGTPFLFDTGVYLAVIGVSLIILSRLMRAETAKGERRRL